MIKTDWNFKGTQSVRRVYGGSVGFRILVLYENPTCENPTGRILLCL